MKTFSRLNLCALLLSLSLTAQSPLFAQAWSAVSAGDFHTLAIKADGTLWAWGDNLAGQLGLGDTLERSVPVQTGHASNWSFAAAGGEHSLAIKADGSLWTWGNNGNGQLGIGSSTNGNSPTQVSGSTDWAAVAGGHAHTVAIKTDGTLWAWGWNANGQLGIGDTTQRNSPHSIGVASDWSSVSGGYAHTLALKTDGTLWAWGWNNYGQLGAGDAIDSYNPVAVSTGGWIAVSAGGVHSAAVKTDGTLWAWGWNFYGQLGLGDTSNRNAPFQVGTDTNWASVFCGEAHTIALKTDGTLWASGWNVNGQLGFGDTTARSAMTQIGSAGNWTAVAGGYGSRHSAAIQSPGVLWMWGGNSYGQLGLGDTTQRNAPEQINIAPTLSWVGTVGYESDGVSPQSGATSDWFYFKVKYTDLNNNPPLSGYPKINLGADGVYTMTEEDIADTDYSNGKIYRWGFNLDSTRDGYVFSAYDSNSAAATGEAASWQGGPIVNDSGYYSIYGYTLDHSSNPIVNIEVGLYDNSVSPPSRIQYHTTNAYGWFEFGGIGGSYGASNVFVKADATNYTWNPGTDGTTSLWSNLRVVFFGTGGYTLAGYCYDNNNPVSNAYVYLHYGGTTFRETYSDSSGYFTFSSVPSANYALSAQKNGQALNTGDGSTVSYIFSPLGQDRYNLNFYYGIAPAAGAGDFQIWNNAFNPKTGGNCVIEADWPAQESARIRIYDLAGRLVKEWTENDPSMTGASWNGRDAVNNIVPNGLYFISVECGSIKKSHPVMILKK